MPSPRSFLVIGAVVLVLLAAVVVLVGRALRAQIGGAARPGGDAPSRRRDGPRDWAVTPLPTGVARTLTERGLVDAHQLARMSPAEREFFVATVATRVGEGPKPRLVPSAAPSHVVGTAVPSAGPAPPDAAASATPAAAAPTSAPAAGAPAAGAPAAGAPALSALVSGPIHCPVCRALVGQRLETPLLMARCPGCGRRIAARADGNRLIVTLDYGATPATGVAPVGGAGPVPYIRR